MSAVGAAVLVKGGDPALVARSAHEAIDALLDGRDASVCVEELGGALGDDLDLARIIDALTTPPFLIDRRVIVVRDVGRLNAEDARRLAEVLADPVEGVALVLVAGGGRLSTVLEKAVSAAGSVIDANVGASVRDRSSYVAERVRASDVRLDADAQGRLVAHVGEDLARVDGVLETLAAAYGEGAALGVEQLEPFLGATGSVPGWDLTDALSAGDAASALGVLHRLVGPGGRAAPEVIGILQGHYVRMMKLDGSGVRTREDAASLLKSSPFPAGKLLAAAGTLGTERIRQAVSWVAQADADVKGATGLEPEIVLEVLVARLARLHRAAGRGGRR